MLLTSLVLALTATLDIGPVTNWLSGYRVLWPQKWTYFTNYDQAVLVAYRIDPEAADLRPSDGRHERGDKLLGFNRIDDVRQVEARVLGGLVPARYWQTCEREELTACLAALDRASFYQVRNPARQPVICGPTAVAAELTAVPPPRTLPNRLNRVIRVAFADVECAS
ncbi:hypothetical protein GCM10011609_65450 [Lentzea pudingi]|uniref:Antimicrobial peptide system protein, SdpA family n=1 Tax=Lentzea pudingi TaxID=1789439 RepID=A0ABQ2ILZ5_9PSEU|nr:hypothetical protein GCM10011609_65450 [Lentzea pudingi]